MNSPRLIIICGLPGSGKTTLATKLKSKFNAISLVPDEWMIELFGYDNRPEDRSNIEKLQLELALKIVTKGVSVILENGFWSAKERLSLIDLAKSNSVDVEAYFLLINDELRESRIEKRNLSLSKHEYRMSDADIKYCRGRFDTPSEDELKLYRKYQIMT
jgi:predicted kinase